MKPLAVVDVELERWRDAGILPRIWLRDDDAIAPTKALDRLIGLTNSYRAPVLLAIVPQPAEAALAGRLEGESLVTPAVHGYAHRNHAPADGKKAELTENARGRDCAEVIRELATGRKKLGEHYGARLSEILVPPWNRISPAVAREIPTTGFAALSLFGWTEMESGLPHLNTHVDLIDWGNGRAGRGLAEVAAALAARLAEARLRGGVPIGLLTHHLAHDDAAWATLEALLDGLAAHGIALKSAAACLSSPRPPTGEE